MTKEMMALYAAGAFILGAVVALGGEHLLFAKSDPRDAMQTIDTLQDWRLTCPPRTDKKGVCVMQSPIYQPGSSTVIAELTVAPKNRADAKSDELTVVTPLGVIVPPGLRLTVGNGQPKTVSYKTCVQIGCIASLPIDSGIASALSQNSSGQITVIAGDAKPVALNFSLRGYRDALAARAVDMAARH